jgi:hypothetical protein
MISNLYFKIGVTIVIIIAFALGLTVMLNYAKFERTFSDLAESRFAFMVRDLRTVTETGLDLGLDLSTMTNVQGIIEREAAKDDQILSIEVFDEQGVILYRTGQSIESPDVPTAWRDAMVATQTDEWRSVNDDALVVGTRLTNNFGSDVGGIALRRDRTQHDSVLARMLTNLSRAAIAMLVIMGIIALFSAFLLFRSTNRSLHRMRQALTDLLDAQKPSGFKPRRRSEMERDYANAEKRSRETLHELDNARGQLERLASKQ